MIHRPSAETFLVLAGAVILMLLGIFAVRRWFAGKQSPGRRRISPAVETAESH
jgi:hypothetical protein